MIIKYLKYARYHTAIYVSEKWKWESLSHVWLFATPYTVHGILQARTRVRSLSLLQNFPQPRDQTQVSCTADGFFTSWATCK